MCLTRRHLLLAALAGVVVRPRAVGGRQAVPGDLLLDVHREGSRIGAQTIRFEAREQGFVVRAIMELEVRIAFITAYRYWQEGRELWRDGRLAHAVIATDDNGERTEVRVEPQGAGLQVEGPHGRYEAPAGTMTDLAFWNPAILRQSRRIDSQHGDLTPIRATPPVEETITVHGRQVDTLRHVVTAAASPHEDGPGREGKVWYDRTGRLVRSEVMTRGELLIFEPRRTG